MVKRVRGGKWGPMRAEAVKRLSEERGEREMRGRVYLWDRRVKGTGSSRQKRIRTLNIQQKRKEEEKIKKKIHLATFSQLHPVA